MSDYDSSRRYLPGTNVLETTFTTPTGTAVLTAFMPTHNDESHTGQPLEFGRSQRVARIIQYTAGTVDVLVEVFPRFGYGTILPHAALSGPHTEMAHGGPGAVSDFCSSPLETAGDGFKARASLLEGEKMYTAITNQTTFSHDMPLLGVADLEKELSLTVDFWEQWSAKCHGQGELHDQVLRSALTLKALTYAPYGALVAAPTTSPPETVGGTRTIGTTASP